MKTSKVPHAADISKKNLPLIKPGYEMSFFIKCGNLYRVIDETLVYPIHLAGRFPPQPCPNTQTTLYHFDTPNDKGHVILNWSELDLWDE
jgi:hypothetical protein